MDQLRRLAAEALEGVPVPGQQGRHQLQPSLLPQPLHARVHHGGAGPLLIVGPQLLVPQPEQKFLRVQVHFRGDLGQLVKPGPVLVPEHLGQVLHQAVVQGHAVQQHLKGVLSGVRVRLRLLRGFLLPIPAQEHAYGRAGVKAVVYLPGDLGAVLGGAQPGQGRKVPHLLQQLHAPGHRVRLRQGDTLRGRPLPVHDLVDILHAIVHQGHKKFLTLQITILNYTISPSPLQGAAPLPH